MLLTGGQTSGARGKQPGKASPGSASAAEQVPENLAMEQEHGAPMQAASADDAGFEGDILEELPLAERLAEKQHQRQLAQAARNAHQELRAAAAAQPDCESFALLVPAHPLQASGKQQSLHCCARSSDIQKTVSALQQTTSALLAICMSLNPCFALLLHRVQPA